MQRFILDFASVEEMVARAQKSASSADRDGELKRYSKAGGRRASHPWKVSGFYASEVGRSRLVFEALHYETRAICVVRVYREDPLEILFARKWAGNDSRFASAFETAAGMFRSALPSEPVAEREADSVLDDMPLSAEERQLIAGVLIPIPPPFVLDAIDEA